MDATSLFLIGLAFGAVLLCLGFAFGMRVGRRIAERSESLDPRHVQEWLGEFTKWTSSFHHDVATYREEMEDFAEKASGITGAGETPRAAVVLELLSQILSSNQRLQQRLTEAEKRLGRQTAELQEYLCEARTDGLTNLPNRRALDEELKRRMAEWRRYRAPFSLALLDIDRFKEINDRYGHVAGDRVLRQVADALRDAMRDADLVARFGGEEFAIVMPATTEQAAHRAAERAREAVERVVVVFDKQEIRPTVSCGVAQAIEDEDMTSLVQRSDAALYSSKFAGRNQCHWHDGHRCIPITGAQHNANTEDPACVSA